MARRISKQVREDAAIACMAVAAARMARGATGDRSPRTEDEIDDARRYGLGHADLALDEVVDGDAAILAQQARVDYAVAASHAEVFYGDWFPWLRPDQEPGPSDLEAAAEMRARHDARIDGLRWAEAAALLLDGWSPC